MGITKDQFYEKNCSIIPQLLKIMSETPLAAIGMGEGGTGLKLTAELQQNQGKAQIKLMRFVREKSVKIQYFWNVG